MGGRSPFFGRALRVSLSVVFAISTLAAAVAPSQTVAVGTQATVGPFTFTIGAYDLHVLAADQLPYIGATLVTTCGFTDENGVFKYRAADGHVYDHPVGQARCALNMLRNYRLDPDPAYLAQSVANADRLLARTVWHAGARFFPYPFDYTMAWRSTMRAPWYSAMAQGQALSVFVRLHELTGDPKWSAAAATTFASFKVARGSGTPWVVGVEAGRLWLDEYPSTPLDRTFNGHNFSAFGLYDYWRTTGSSEARLLLLGALHSTYVEASTRVRVPGGISQYCVSDPCMANKIRNPGYHVTHIGQLAKLHDITGHWHFASLAEAFLSDSPRPSSGTAMLAAGVHRGYRFDAAGAAIEVATASLPSQTAVPFSLREAPAALRRPGNGVWLRLADGPLAGLYVRESDRAWPIGFVDQLTFLRGRRVQVPGGTYVGQAVGPDGTVTESVSVAVPASTWTYDAYARLNGAPSVRLTTGPLAGSWLRLDARTLRDTTLFTDVDASPFRTDVIWLDAQNITRGCAPYRYCPDTSVTREQMASFLVRALRLPAAPRDFFDDDDGRITEGDINRLAAAGIAAGCGAGRFCPTRPISRGEMASFLVRALHLPPSGQDLFVDDDGSVHEHDINRLAAAGITRGCSADRFCPGAPVTRGQMAAFLRRALTLGAVATAGAAADDPKATASPSPTSTPSPTPAPSGTPMPTPSPTPVPTSGDTPAPSIEPIGTPVPSASPQPTSTSEPTPTPSAPPETDPPPSADP